MDISMQVTQPLCSTQTVNITDNQLNHRLASFRLPNLSPPLSLVLLDTHPPVPLARFLLPHTHTPTQSLTHTIIFNLPPYFKAAPSFISSSLLSLFFFSPPQLPLALAFLFHPLFDLHFVQQEGVCACAFVVLCASTYAVKKKGTTNHSHVFAVRQLPSQRTDYRYVRVCALQHFTHKTI